MSPEPKDPGRLVRLLLRLYPAAFREEFGEELAWFIEQRRQESRFSPGLRGRVALAIHLVADSVQALPRAHARAFAARWNRRHQRTASPALKEQRMQTLLQDLRFSVRTLLRRPGYTVVGILTLMLGIGANTAIFSVVNAVLLRPLPYPAPDRLAVIWGARGTEPELLLSVPDVLEMASRNHSFEALGIMRVQSVNLTGTEAPDRLIGSFVTASSLTLLGAHTALGRLFTPEETAIGTGQRVAVLSNPVWQGRFGADPGIVGRTIILNGLPHVVIGVTAPDFTDPFVPEVWLPITSAPNASWLSRDNPNVWAIGRLKAGVAFDAAARDLSALSEALAAQYPATNAGMGVHLVGLKETLVGSVRPALIMVLGFVSLVLLIACANVANLQLARAASRQREISLRAALGAGRSRLIRQFLTESLLLSALGGLAGLGFAYWAVHGLAAAIPGGFPTFGPIGLDGRVLGFSALVTVLTGLVFGAAPARLAGRTDVNDALKSRSEVGMTRGRWDARNLFVATQLALCIVLLVGAGLLTRSLTALQRVDPGFNSEHLLSAEFRLPATKYQAPEQITDFRERALAQLRAIRGVRSAALVRSLPLSGNWGRDTYAIDGQPAPGTGLAPMTQQNDVSDGYFQTMEMSILQGRDFGPQDRPGSPMVAIVNQEMARRSWPGQSALGKRFRLIGPPEVWLTVVGVVGDVKQLTLTEAPTPQVYQPMAQVPAIFSTVVMRTEGDPDAVANQLRSAIWAVDKDQPVWKVRSLESLVRRDVAPARFSMMLIVSFALLALVLAAVGVYGVMSYAVVQRTREVGIRMALGARRAEVIRLVLGRGLRVVGAATVVGLLASLGASRLLSSQLFGVTATDPVTFLLVPAVLASVAVVACYLPARRASRVDPMAALRSE